MHVDLRTQVPHGHGRALDVPAGPPATKSRWPRRFVRSRPAPQRKIQLIALRLGTNRPQQTLVTQLAQHRPPRAMRQATEASIPASLEIQRIRLVRESVAVKTCGCLENLPHL